MRIAYFLSQFNLTKYLIMITKKLMKF